MRHWEIQEDLVKIRRVTISAVHSFDASVPAHAHYAEEGIIPLQPILQNKRLDSYACESPMKKWPRPYKGL